MKIAIANSLLEPAGIPWFISYRGGRLSGWIMGGLYDLFKELERVGVLPSAGGNCMSVEDTRKLLENAVKSRGAEEALVTCSDLQRHGKWVGYVFVIGFTEPGRSKIHWMKLTTLF